MTEFEIQHIVSECVDAVCGYGLTSKLPWSQRQQLMKTIGRRIMERLGEKRRAPVSAPPVYVPGKACTCGAQRSGITKHYNYCDLG